MEQFIRKGIPAALMTLALATWVGVAVNAQGFTGSGFGAAQSGGDVASENPGEDAGAVHVNKANEIAPITNKATPVAADVILIEDSEDSLNKKHITYSQLPGGSTPGLGTVLAVSATTGGTPIEVSAADYIFGASDTLDLRSDPAAHGFRIITNVSDQTIMEGWQAGVSSPAATIFRGAPGSGAGTGSTLIFEGGAQGGQVDIRGADGGLGLGKSGGQATVRAGDAGTVAGNGGGVLLEAGDALANNDDGGDVEIRAGQAVGTGVAGDIRIESGRSVGGTGTDGQIVFRTSLSGGSHADRARVTDRGIVVDSGHFLALADGTAGEIVYSDGSGELQLLTAGGSGQVLKSGGAAAPFWQNGSPDAQIYTSAGFTTTSSTDVLITGLTATPAAGQWLVTVSSSGYPQSVNSTQVVSIYKNTGQALNGESSVSSGGSQTNNLCMGHSVQALITTNGTDTIEARLRATGGGFTAELFDTQMTLLEVK